MVVDSSSAKTAASASLEKNVLAWLVGLRWIVIGILLASLPATSALLDLHVHYEIAISAICVLVALNLASRRIERAFPDDATGRLVFASSAVDVLAIAVFLGASGGAANPFSAILLVYVALGASLLSPKRAFGLAALAACTFGALFIVPMPTGCPDHPTEVAFSNHLYGMWVAFALGASLVAFSLVRVRRAMEAAARELAELRVRAEQAEKFAAVATLAAGTAHELGTPLATIRVLARELKDGGTEEQLRVRADRIATQVERCVSVLDRMRPGGAQSSAGATDLRDSVTKAVDAWQAAHPEARVEIAETAPAHVPLGGSEVEAAIIVLLDNALAADDARTAVARGELRNIRVRSGSVGDEPFVAVDDEGPGMTPEVIRRAGEPFFTTKAPGAGMGLGLFVVRSLLHRIGGRLEIERRDPRGTTVRLWFGASRLATS